MDMTRDEVYNILKSAGKGKITILWDEEKMLERLLTLIKGYAEQGIGRMYIDISAFIKSRDPEKYRSEREYLIRNLKFRGFLVRDRNSWDRVEMKQVAHHLSKPSELMQFTDTLKICWDDETDPALRKD